MIAAMAKEHRLIVTVEENALQGGAGSAVNECLLLQQAADNHIINLAIADTFIDHGNHEQQLAECGLDAAGIVAAINAADRDHIPTSSQVEPGLTGS